MSVLALGELLRFDNSEALTCSPALALYCTTKVFSAREVRRALIEIAARAYELRTDAVFREIYEGAIQHGKIKELFSQECVDDELVIFYDELKNMGCARDNPYFWLQFSIAMWSKRERGLVDGYLIKAREVGSRIVGFRPYQINNFDARVRLETIIDAIVGHQKGLADLRFALKVIESQLLDEKTRDYPLHLVARLCKVTTIVGPGLKVNERRELIARLTSLEHRMPDTVCGSEYPEFCDASVQKLQAAVAELHALSTVKDSGRKGR